MPVEFFGSMFYEPDRERSPYEFGVLLELILGLFLAAGSTLGYVLDPDDNRISLTINDDARSDEMTVIGPGSTLATAATSRRILNMSRLLGLRVPTAA